MKVKHLLAPTAVALSLLFTTPGVAQPADPAPLVTGKQWTESDASHKKAFLLGVANLLQVERAYQEKRKLTDTQTLVPRFATGLQNQTLDSVRDTLDKWYAANPTKLDRPVMETLWFEVVAPGTKRKP
ncbi:hypothetical protein ACFZAI_28145 [Achromobacter sp. NPDC008082]|uniref:hypothetical protein n=1 Tax=Achromobacter sp. NPDC008082 TaxID=3363888 RepID=UPI0036EB271F